MLLKTLLYLTFLTFSGLSLSQARRELEKRKAVQNTKIIRLASSPRVMEECGCLTFGTSSSFCVDMTPPMVKVGWATDQVFSEDSGR